LFAILTAEGAVFIRVVRAASLQEALEKWKEIRKEREAKEREEFQKQNTMFPSQWASTASPGFDFSGKQSLASEILGTAEVFGLTGKPVRRYPATIMRIIDGDTIEARVDLGMGVKWDSLCRLRGINTPEMNTAQGKEARERLRIHILETNKGGFDVTLETTRDQRDKYGRLLVIVLGETADGEKINYNSEMIRLGHAEPYATASSDDEMED
jgi:endonuclease YncB( thermonuclease family)